MSVATQRNKIAIFFDTSCKAGCERIAGALDFIAHNTSWEPHLVQLARHTPREIQRDLWGVHPAGAILQCRLPSSAYPKTRLKIPVVTIDGYSWEWNLRPSVRILLDENAIGRASASFFRKRGFDSVAYVGSLIENESKRSQVRGRVFEKTFCELGGQCRRHEPRHQPVQAQEGELAEFLATLPHPCGVFAYSDYESTRVIALCRQLKISVPKQLSVLGVDNNEQLCESGTTTTSSIQPDFWGCGYASAQALKRLLDRPVHALSRQVTFGVRSIVERKSTQDFGAAHRLTAKAKELIAAHHAERFNMGILTSELGISLRVLEKVFHDTTGHSLRSELKECRLQSALSLLAERNNSIADVAWKSGLGSSVNLCVLFKRRFGTSPNAWRKSHQRVS